MKRPAHARVFSALLRRPPVPAKAGFVVAGVQKGGTSALFAYLQKHPNVGLPVRKELHFFDNDEATNWNDPDYLAYHRHFHLIAGAHAYGEASPSYLTWPATLDRLRVYNPEIKIVLLFRDPVTRAASHWRHKVSKGSERRSFTEFVRDGIRGDVIEPPELLRRDPHHPVARGMYAHLVRRLWHAFPREQCLLFRSEDLATRHAETLATICRFLGVPPFPRMPKAHRKHTTRRTGPGDPSGPTAEDCEWLSSIFTAEMDEFSRLTGLDTADWCQRSGSLSQSSLGKG
jgi:hypothetical protein